MKDWAIQVEHLTKVFGEDIILKDISYNFEKNKVHGIVGLNGSGKTVFLKCICGFLNPTKGKIIVAGKQVGKEIDFPDSLGMIIENPGFLSNLSGFKNLKLLAAVRKKNSKKEIMDAMRRVGLEPESKKRVGKYSLGMRERLGIAQAIMENPDILILDEPLNGLDKQGVKEVYDLILELKKEGKTILLVSHNAVDIETLCDTVCEMELGKINQIR